MSEDRTVNSASKTDLRQQPEDLDDNDTLQGSESSPSTDNEAETDASKPSDSRWRPQDIVFAFGPDQAVFISSTLGKWYFYGQKSTAHRINSMKGHKPVAVALTSHGGFICVYEAEDGTSTIETTAPSQMISSNAASNWAEASKQSQRLYDFISEPASNDIRRKLSFTIGPGSSWFARRGDIIAHNTLPGKLLEKIEQKKVDNVYPYQVALGMHGSYIVLWSDQNSWSWELNGYDEAIQYMQDGEGFNTVVLSPFDCSQFFLVREDGLVVYKLSGDRAMLEYIDDETQSYMQRRARRDGTVFNVMKTGKSTTITPETNYDTELSHSYRSSAILRQLRLVNLSGRSDMFSWPSWRKLKGAAYDHRYIIGGALVTTAMVGAAMYLSKQHQRAVAEVGPGTSGSGPGLRAMIRITRLPQRTAQAAAIAATGAVIYLIGREQGRRYNA